MNSVQSIESLAGDAQHKLSRTLGPTLVISMAYIDLGKWLVAVDAGSRFGYDLVLLVLLFNFSAILFQYLSTCIGMVTGKNLAEVWLTEHFLVLAVAEITRRTLTSHYNHHPEISLILADILEFSIWTWQLSLSGQGWAGFSSPECLYHCC